MGPVFSIFFPRKSADGYGTKEFMFAVVYCSDIES